MVGGSGGDDSRRAGRTPGGRIFREGHANYAELFEEVDRLPDVKTTAFRFTEVDADSGDSPSGAA